MTLILQLFEDDDGKSGEGDAESTDSLEVELGGAGARAPGDVVSGSASLDSFEADSLKDDVDEEPTLVSSQSQDSLSVAAGAATPMDISFGSSGAWSQSTVSSCTTLGSSSDGEALTGSGTAAAAERRRLSEPSSGEPPSSSPLTRLPLSFDNTTLPLLDAEGNVVVVDDPRTRRLADADSRLDNRQSETADKHPARDERTDEGQPGAASAADSPPGTLSSCVVLLCWHSRFMYLI